MSTETAARCPEKVTDTVTDGRKNDVGQISTQRHISVMALVPALVSATMVLVEALLLAPWVDVLAVSRVMCITRPEMLELTRKF